MCRVGWTRAPAEVVHKHQDRNSQYGQMAGHDILYYAQMKICMHAYLSHMYILPSEMTNTLNSPANTSITA